MDGSETSLALILDIAPEHCIREGQVVRCGKGT